MTFKVCRLCNSPHPETIQAIIDNDIVDVCEEEYREYLKDVDECDRLAERKKIALELTNIWAASQDDESLRHSSVLDVYIDIFNKLRWMSGSFI